MSKGEKTGGRRDVVGSSTDSLNDSFIIIRMASVECRSVQCSAVQYTVQYSTEAMS